MKHEELQKACETLAAKYKNSLEFDDLVSEGYLAGLESINEGNPPEVTYNKARKAMHTYYNLKLKPVHIPRSDASDRAIANISRGTIPEDLRGTQRALYAALRGETDMVEANTIRDELSTEDRYIQREYIGYLMDLVFSDEVGLTSLEQAAIYEKYVLGKTFKLIAEENCVSSEAIAARSRNGIKKLKDKLKGQY